MTATRNGDGHKRSFKLKPDECAVAPKIGGDSHEFAGQRLERLGGEQLGKRVGGVKCRCYGLFRLEEKRYDLTAETKQF
ncbi:hypothetical protein [uncultured Pseudacidovorax sp.]|uniref:hypothetical protein n=1 Tax=uncultured Pseudacidovorax sp. TaxID=679313 RepID=UPI0025E5042C|nr:hypothetical protein [uncultured Pseudacidovorax sp.]